MRVVGALVTRLETSAAAIGLESIAVMQRRDPSCPADAIAFNGGALIASGPGRYVNRAVGATIDELSATALDALEAFYVSRGLRPALEVSAWAPASTISLLRARGFGVDWFRAVFAMDLGATAPADSSITIEAVDDHTRQGWLDVLAAANGISDPAARAISDEHALSSDGIAGASTFVAIVDGAVVGCGSIQVAGGVAWLGGAGTHPDLRGRGVQTALLHHRLQHAARSGDCDLAAATAVPAGGSARNLVATGFQHIETQAVFSLDPR